MNVASLKLCKELYDLSGWAGTSKRYSKVAGEYRLESPVTEAGKRGSIPAYDLGYLMRELRAVSDPHESDTFYAIRLDYTPTKKTLWRCNLQGGLYGVGGRADTPEDCAAELAIELFKQGILKKEAN